MRIDGIEAFTVTTSGSGWQKHPFSINGRDTYVIPVEMENSRIQSRINGKGKASMRSEVTIGNGETLNTVTCGLKPLKLFDKHSVNN